MQEYHTREHLLVEHVLGAPVPDHLVAPLAWLIGHRGAGLRLNRDGRIVGIVATPNVLGEILADAERRAGGAK